MKRLNGERLRQLREEKNISMEFLANNVGVSFQMINFLEKEQRYASEKLLIRLADYFNVSTDYLLGRDSKPTNTA